MGEHIKRVQFDAERHCGHKVERDPDALQERVDKWQAVVDELRTIQLSRSLNRNESFRLRRKIKNCNIYRKNIEKYRSENFEQRPCVKSKGQGTDHPGVGKCKYHCKCRGREGYHGMHIYARAGYESSLMQVMDQLAAAEHDILDLTPDINLMRAKITTFIENNPDDYTPEGIKSFALLIETLRRLVETVFNKRFQNTITLDTLNTLLFRMGDVLTKYVNEPEVLERIMADWNRIAVDTNPKKKMIVGNVEVETTK